jgi:signal transduction histidine kinase
MPTVEPFMEALGPVALGDAIHCPIATGDGLAGMLCLYTAWSRPFQPDRADRATEGAELAATLLAEASRSAPTGRAGDDKTMPTLSLAVSLLNHDMRSPIHAILGFCELLASRDGASDEDIRYADSIREGGEQMSRQLDQLVGLMRLLLGETLAAPAPTPLVKVLDELGCPTVPKLTVLWDAALVRTALTDLLDYTELAGIGRDLTVSSGEGRVYLTIGQTPEAAKPVDPGFRSASVQRARHLIAIHGGTLQSDRSGCGFTVELPLAP